MNKEPLSFTNAFVLMLQIALIFPAFASEGGISNRNESDYHSQIYLSGRKEGEFFWKYEEVFTCPESSFDSKKRVYRSEDCTPRSVGICQKVYRLKDGSLASGSTCQESCLRAVHKDVYVPSTCTLF